MWPKAVRIIVVATIFVIFLISIFRHVEAPIQAYPQKDRDLKIMSRTVWTIATHMEGVQAKDGKIFLKSVAGPVVGSEGPLKCPHCGGGIHWCEEASGTTLQNGISNPVQIAKCDDNGEFQSNWVVLSDSTNRVIPLTKVKQE